MKLLLLLLTIPILILNLKAYKNLFKPYTNDQVGLDKFLNEESSKIGGKRNAKVFSLIIVGFLSTLLVAFNFIVGLVVDHPVVIFLAALMIAIVTRGFIRSAKSIMTEKYIVPNRFYKVVIPVQTLYLLYFAYYVLLVM